MWESGLNMINLFDKLQRIEKYYYEESVFLKEFKKEIDLKRHEIIEKYATPKNNLKKGVIYYVANNYNVERIYLCKNKEFFEIAIGYKSLIFKKFLKKEEIFVYKKEEVFFKKEDKAKFLAYNLSSCREDDSSYQAAKTFYNVIYEIFKKKISHLSDENKSEIELDFSSRFSIEDFSSARESMFIFSKIEKMIKEFLSLKFPHAK